MVDVSYQVLKYMHDKYGPHKSVAAAMTHESRGIPRHVRAELMNEFGRDVSLGDALKRYHVHPVAKNFR